MNFIEHFESQLPKKLQKKFNSLNSPFQVQEYLNSITYKGEERDRSPLNVMRDNQGHCLDGGFLGALCLWRIGFKPLLIDIVPDPGVDDDHVLALYQIEGRWGAVAKTNYVFLGFREPVYKNLRELVMTYFEHYVSIKKIKCLTGYTRIFNAANYTRYNWAWDEAGANTVYHKHFYGRKAIPLITKSMGARLSPATGKAYKAETLFTDLNESFGNRNY
jgi:hypothetical protein